MVKKPDLNRATQTRLEVNTDRQTGLEVSHDGKTVKGDLVDAVLQEADHVREEERAIVRRDAQEQERVQERVQQAQQAREARPLHERAMDTKHQVAAELRAQGVDPSEAESRASSLVERSLRNR